jgi:7-carboxy-7-deazaguanine synthase
LNNSHATANLIEVFSAIQGEGLNIGTRQIFIRLARCDLRCHFCDSSHTWGVPKTLRVEKTPGLRDFEIYTNPVALQTLIEWVMCLNRPHLHDSISLTGGEPLLQGKFLQEFLPQVKEVTGLPIYLETGGHLPIQLSQVLPNLDSVGMDMKLPSVSGETRWDAHRDFLQRCTDSQVEVFVKLIVSRNTAVEDLQQAGELIADIDPAIIVYLQPVTPIEQPAEAVPIFPPTPRQVLAWQGLMKEWVQQVRVIPQTHKMIGQL